MRKLYKIRIEADDETIFYAHIQSYIVLKKN